MRKKWVGEVAFPSEGPEVGLLSLRKKKEASGEIRLEREMEPHPTKSCGQNDKAQFTLVGPDQEWKHSS